MDYAEFLMNDSTNEDASGGYVQSITPLQLLEELVDSALIQLNLYARDADPAERDHIKQMLTQTFLPLAKAVR